ncbi:MAG: hypothetical protein JNK87_21885 [Bryobacterales bacterium]|nr:hypothetical protein [Bryobacterales bacterium]
MNRLLVGILALISTGATRAQNTSPPLPSGQTIQCSGELCEECIDPATAPLPITPLWMKPFDKIASARGERATDLIGIPISVTYSPKAAEVAVETVLPDGTRVLSKMKTAATEVIDGTLTPQKAKELTKLISQHEDKIRAAGRRVSHWNLKGIQFGLGALFLLALEGSATAGQYAAKEVGAWVTANNRGEDCSKLVRWLAESAKACSNECADCYAKRLETIPSRATATQCYADITAVTQKIFPEIEQLVNERAQSVVVSCGARKGGWATVRNAQKPIFDGLNVPSIDQVCPFR